MGWLRLHSVTSDWRPLNPAAAAAALDEAGLINAIVARYVRPVQGDAKLDTFAARVAAGSTHAGDVAHPRPVETSAKEHHL